MFEGSCRSLLSALRGVLTRLVSAKRGRGEKVGICKTEVGRMYGMAGWLDELGALFKVDQPSRLGTEADACRASLKDHPMDRHDCRALEVLTSLS